MRVRNASITARAYRPPFFTFLYLNETAQMDHWDIHCRTDGPQGSIEVGAFTCVRTASLVPLAWD